MHGLDLNRPRAKLDWVPDVHGTYAQIGVYELHKRGKAIGSGSDLLESTMGAALTRATKAKKNVAVETPSSSSKRAPKAGASSQEEAKPRKRAKAKKEEDGDSGVPPSPSKKAKKEEEEAEDQYKWWEAENQENDGSIKWTTLEHNGVIFAPPYEPLPSNVKMKYAGMLPYLPSRLCVR